MIIQCEQCRTKFRLDDARIKDNGVKVRCARCRHVFTVTKQQPAPAADFGIAFDQAATIAAPAPAMPETGSFSVETVAFLDSGPAPEPHEPVADSPAIAQPAASDFDFGDFEAPEEKPAPTPFQEPAVPPPAETAETPQPQSESPALQFGELDFGAVDFGASQGDSAPAGDEPVLNPMAGVMEQTEETPPGLDSKAFDDLFAAEQPTASPAPAPPDVAKGPIEFDFDVSPPPVAPSHQGPAAESEDIRQFITPPPAEKVSPEKTPAEAPPQPRPVSEPAVVVPSSAVAGDIAAKKAPEPPKAAPAQPAPPPSGEELPPLSIPSRKKRSPLLKVLTPLLILALLAAGVFFGKDRYPELLGKFMRQDAKLTVNSVKSTFVKNAVLGKEILVISGEAVNDSSSPRAALQVKGMVYGDKDQILVSKNAYCGNQLTTEQVATMSPDALEGAMANQLGNALSNLEVAPGKSLPFTVVITALPEGAKNFGVEPAGSQAVAAKPN